MAVEIIKNDSGMVTKAIIKDVKVAYVRVAKPDTQVGGGEKFSVVTVIEDKEDLKTLKSLSKSTFTTIEGEEANTKYNTKTEKGLVYVAKYKANTTIMKDDPTKGVSKGDPLPYDSTFRPKVYDAAGNDITMTTMAGNGSTADVEIRFGVNKKYGDEANAYLDKITITNLVEAPQKPGQEIKTYSKPYASQTENKYTEPRVVPIVEEYIAPKPLSKNDTEGFDPF